MSLVHVVRNPTDYSADIEQIFHYVQYDMDIEYKRQGTRAKAPVIPTRSEESLRIVSKYYTDYNLRLLYLQLIYLLLF